MVWSLMNLVEIVSFHSLTRRGNILSALENGLSAAFLEHLVTS